MNNLWNRFYLMELFTSFDLFVDTACFFKRFIYSFLMSDI